MLIPKIIIEKMSPSQNITPEILYNQFELRKNNVFVGKNQIVIADMQEAIWWNRPQKENTESLIKKETDGFYSYNLPLFLRHNKWKSNYNVLLNKNNVPIAIHIQFDHKLEHTEIQLLRTATFSAIRKALVELGVPNEEIIYINNELLLKGKKFVGSEQIIGEDFYEENTFITLKYLEEKEIFDRLLYGKATPKYGITGVLDEFNLFTKKEFIQKFIKYFELHFKNNNI